MNDDATTGLLGELAAAIRSVLGPDLVGLWLYGSYVSGGFDQGVSDLDLVAVTRVDAAGLDLEEIGAMHATLAERHPSWTDRIEVVYIGQDSLRAFRSSKGHLAVISPGEPLHLRPEPPVEWIQNWYLVRETGVTLDGARPESVIPEVGWAEFVNASRRYTAELAGRDLTGSGAGSLAYAVLTVCRAEEAVIGGNRLSKADAAAAAQRRHPEFAELIEEALKVRLGRGSVDFNREEVRSRAVEFVRSVAGSMRQS